MIWLALALVLLSGPAWAMDEAYCTLFAREFTRVALAHNKLAMVTIAQMTELPDRVKGSPEKELTWLLSRNFHVCLNSDNPPLMPPVPEGTDAAWVTFMLVMNTAGGFGPEGFAWPPPPSPGAVEEPPQGSVPATDRVVDEGKDAWCRKNYRSFNPSDGSVKRHSEKTRTPCPFPG